MNDDLHRRFSQAAGDGQPDRPDLDLLWATGRRRRRTRRVVAGVGAVAVLALGAAAFAGTRDDGTGVTAAERTTPSAAACALLSAPLPEGPATSLVGADASLGTVLDAVNPDRVIVYTNADLSESDTAPLVAAVRSQFGVSAVEPVSRDAVYAEFRRLFADRPDMLRAITPDQLPGKLVVTIPLDEQVRFVEWAEEQPLVVEARSQFTAMRLLLDLPASSRATLLRDLRAVGEPWSIRLANSIDAASQMTNEDEIQVAARSGMPAAIRETREAVAGCGMTDGDDTSTVDPDRPPRAQLSADQEVYDHWHEAFAISVCGTELPALVDVGTDRLGIHTHGDGLIHIHPFSETSAGANATMGRFFDQVGLKTSGNGVDAGTSSADPATLETSFCGGKPGHWVLAHWTSAAAAATGAEPDEVITDIFAAVPFQADLGAYTLAFVAYDDTAPIPAPSTAGDIEALGAVDAAGGATETTEASGRPGTTEEAGATTASTPPSTGADTPDVTVPPTRPAVWRLAPGAVVTPSSTSIEVEVATIACNVGSQPMVGQTVSYSRREVQVVARTLGAEDATTPERSCLTLAWTPATLDLGEPLGERTLVDGTCATSTLESFCDLGGSNPRWSPPAGG